MQSKRILLLGGDSFLGQQMAKDLIQLGHQVTTTTRRRDKVSQSSMLLDLADLPSQLPSGFEHAILLAGIWNYQECETSPLAWKVNVDNMGVLARHLLKNNCQVSFVSSNTVFGGERPWCNEDDEHTPAFAYAKHKAAGEAIILKAAHEEQKSDHLTIIRLTKILGLETSPIPAWLKNIANGSGITPFSDLIFAPISVEYASNGVIKIALSGKAGNFHLSGKENVDYTSFAKQLTERFKLKQASIEATTSVAAGISIPFLPTYSGLGMQRTQSLLGIKPQSLDDVLDELYYHYNQK